MISIIVATDDDLLIGKKDSSNGMPWHNKEDLQLVMFPNLKITFDELFDIGEY